MENKATIAPNEIAIRFSAFENREYLTFPIEGWDEVKKLTKKVLVFQGNRFTFAGWNSDRNDCTFTRAIGSERNVATFAKK